MSDLFYSVVTHAGASVFRYTCKPTVLGQEYVDRNDSFILASTHTSAYDVPLLMYHNKRHLDFVSTTEVFANPFAAWFYGSMNAFPLDRHRRDTATVRTIIHKLSAGRVVAMFPEGQLSPGSASVVHSKKIHPGIGKLAKIARVNIVPAVLINSGAYSKPGAWLPLGQTRYGVAFGPPIAPQENPRTTEQQLVDQLVFLNTQLIENMEK